MKSICFQFIWIYVQLFFFLNIKENLWIKKVFNWNPLTLNTFESTFNWFSFQTSMKSLEKKNVFNWNSLIFNSFGSMCNWFSSWISLKTCLIRIFFNWNPLTFILLNLLSIDFPFKYQWPPFDKKNGFQLKSIDFQLIWIYFQLMFLLNLKEISW